MSLLDTILAAQSSGPVILSEQHDVSKINWVNGMTDPGEMIRCGYRPELRRQSGESDAEYAARILPLVEQLPEDERYAIQFSAINRAALDTSTGKVAVMVAGAAPWHRLGVNVESAVDSADAMRLASLRWAGTTPEERRAFLRDIGRKGGRKRKRILSAKRRREIAQHAASVRWGAVPIDGDSGE